MAVSNMSKMASERAINERVGNNLLFLYLVDETSKSGQIEDDLKAQKLVFLSEKHFIQKKMKVFNYNFFRWHRGPYCKDLANDIKGLVKAGLLRRANDRIELTDLGKEVVARCEAILMIRPEFIAPIKTVAKEYGSIPSDDLKEMVYNMTIFVPRVRKVMKIRDIEEKKLLLFKLSEEKAKKTFNLDENLQATLELIFDKKAMDSLKTAQQDAIEGRVCDFNSL